MTLLDHLPKEEPSASQPQIIYVQAPSPPPTSTPDPPKQEGLGALGAILIILAITLIGGMAYWFGPEILSFTNPTPAPAVTNPGAQITIVDGNLDCGDCQFISFNENGWPDWVTADEDGNLKPTDLMPGLTQEYQNFGILNLPAWQAFIALTDGDKTAGQWLANQICQKTGGKANGNADCKETVLSAFQAAEQQENPVGTGTDGVEYTYDGPPLGILSLPPWQEDGNLASTQAPPPTESPPTQVPPPTESPPTQVPPPTATPIPIKEAEVVGLWDLGEWLWSQPAGQQQLQADCPPKLQGQIMTHQGVIVDIGQDGNAANRYSQDYCQKLGFVGFFIGNWPEWGCLRYNGAFICPIAPEPTATFMPTVQLGSNVDETTTYLDISGVAMWVAKQPSGCLQSKITNPNKDWSYLLLTWSNGGKQQFYSNLNQLKPYWFASGDQPIYICNYQSGATSQVEFNGTYISPFDW